MLWLDGRSGTRVRWPPGGCPAQPEYANPPGLEPSHGPLLPLARTAGSDQDNGGEDNGRQALSTDPLESFRVPTACMPLSAGIDQGIVGGDIGRQACSASPPG